jgi:hypothetical protein
MTAKIGALAANQPQGRRIEIERREQIICNMKAASQAVKFRILIFTPLRKKCVCSIEMLSETMSTGAQHYAKLATNIRSTATTI